MLERATLFFWPIQKFTANGVSLVMKVFLYGKTFLRFSLRSCVYKYMLGLGEGGVPSGRIQEQDFSHFVISFLRKHIVRVKLLSKLPSPEGQMMPLINTHSHTCLPLVSCPPCVRLPARNGMVNKVESLGLVPQNGGRPMRLRDC